MEKLTSIRLDFQSPYPLEECHKRLMAHATYPPSLKERLFQGKRYLDIKLQGGGPDQEIFILVSGTTCSARGLLQRTGDTTHVVGRVNLHWHSLLTFTPSIIFAVAAYLFHRISFSGLALFMGSILLFIFVWMLFVDRAHQKKLAHLIEATLRE
jgi:hypothetical protein